MRSLLLLMSLLLLSVLIHDVQGRRLAREGSVLAEDGKHTLHKEEEFAVVKGSSGDEERESKKGSSGSIRKLNMIQISSTTTIAKNYKNGEFFKADHPKMETLTSTNSEIGREEENLSVNSSLKTPKMQDNLDIAEMDYTFARRKPPIHN